jgi:hypothetical protein
MCHCEEGVLPDEATNARSDMLPIVILFISQLHQQIPCRIFEYPFMFIREMFLPFTGFA